MKTEMLAAAPSEDEGDRIEGRISRVLDSPPERAFDDVTRLAARICGTRFAAVSLLDGDRVRFKSHHGFDMSDVPARETCCALVAASGQPMEVRAMRDDPRFAEFPMVTGAPHVRFYAAVPLVTADARSIGALCVMHDAPYALDALGFDALATLGRQVVTELELRAQVERADESRRLLHQMFDANPSPMWIADARTGRFLTLNHAALALYGYSREEFLSMRREELTTDAGGATQEAQGRLTAHRKRSGELIEVEERAHALLFRTQEAQMVMVTDVTSRMAIDAQLREQAALLDAATDAIVLRDLDDRVRYWNESASKLYEVPRAQALGRPMSELVSRADPRAQSAWRAALAKGQWSGELTTASRSGRERVTVTRLTLVRDERGAARSVLQIDSDVTDRKLLESQLLRAQRLESLGMLASGIAHDLNNALQPIVMAIDLLRNPTDLELVREISETLVVAARRGADMVRQVTMFSRGAEGRKVRVQPQLVVRDVARLVNDSFPKSVKFELDVAPDAWEIDADPTQIHQVLVNLCVNARDALPQGGRLSLSVENLELDEHYTSMVSGVKPGGYVVFTVRDTGTGIPPEIQDKIFEPFFTTKEAGHGTGLGLSTAMVIVRSHEGYLTFESRVGRGTTFKVHIPRARSRETGDGYSIMPSTPSTLPRGSGECVLVVDDEENIRGVMKHTLAAFGYEVLTASDGAEAVATYAANRDRVAVVVMDMMMPVMDGPAAIHALKTLSPGLAVIAASGLANDAHRERAERLGVRDFLPKPYTAETLLKAIRDALPRG